MTHCKQKVAMATFRTISIVKLYKICLKGVELELQNFKSLSCGVLGYCVKP